MNNNGSCEDPQGGEIVPFMWSRKKGPRMLSMEGMNLLEEPWVRAQAISGNGRVVLGNSNFQKAYAWIDEGKPIDLLKLVGAMDGYAVNFDASRVALRTSADSMLLWDTTKGTGPKAFTKTKPLQWCIDLPLVTWFGGDACANATPAEVLAQYGPIPVDAFDMSDDGRIVIGRAGSFDVGFIGVMWIEQLGWIKLNDFFRGQGVAEAYRFGMDNPLSISGSGRELVGGLVGVGVTWYVDMASAYVCTHGRSKETVFPNEFIDEVKHGARMGRCEHLN